MFALVDDEDYDFLNQFTWSARKSRKKYWYAQRMYTKNGGRRTILMHRLILGVTNPKIFTDHEDHNGLNNQRKNLRVATPAQNSANKSSHKNASSKYLGVSWDKKLSKWRSRIMTNGVNKNLGFFRDEADAAIAYNEAAIKLHQEFANINIVAA